MHYSIVVYILGTVLRIEGALCFLPSIVGLSYNEIEAAPYVMVAVLSYLAGLVISSHKPENFALYAREGIASVALSWIMISVVGAVPLCLSGDIPVYTDALFEAVSGFTTTGASVVRDVGTLSHTSVFWIALMQWVGGMGVIVFMLAVAPVTGSYNMQLMKAETPGPSVGKLVPRASQSAKILYMLYIAMSGIELVVLLLSRMPLFDAVCTTFALAGTGGYGIHADSAASFTILQQGIITVTVILFSVNFNAYYYLLKRDFKEILRMEEVRWFLFLLAGGTVLVTLNLWMSGIRVGDSLLLTFHQAIFQTSAAISTNGMSIVDYNTWPMFSRNILILFMFIGGCAGSTSCGIKIPRIMILFKSMRQEMKRTIHPKSVSTLCVDGRPADRTMTRSVIVYLATYAFIFGGSLILLSLDPSKGFFTDFSAVLAGINNIGPGFEGIGPTECYSGFTLLSKFVLMFDMLAGRLELYPMLLVFSPAIWKKY